MNPKTQEEWDRLFARMKERQLEDRLKKNDCATWEKATPNSEYGTHTTALHQTAVLGLPLVLQWMLETAAAPVFLKVFPKPEFMIFSNHRKNHEFNNKKP